MATASAAAERLFNQPPLARRIEGIRPAADPSPEDLAAARARVREATADQCAASAAEAQKDALARVRRYKVARSSGWWGTVAMAPLGEGKGSPARAAMDLAALRADGETLETRRAAETRAGAARLLSLGLAGRIWARACRLSRSGAARWMRTHSRREAMTRAELGAAAGVDDSGAWRDWAGEIESIYRAAYLSAAARGLRVVERVQSREARGLSRPGTARAVARLIFERGVRVGSRIEGGVWTPDPDGIPHRVTGERGFWVGGTIIPGELVGRGEVWQRAAREAAREANAARYGRGGRDGREVAADWRLTGDVNGEDVERGADDWVTVGEHSPDGSGVMMHADRFFRDGARSSRPDQSAGSGRRAEFEQAARAAIADNLRVARAERRAKLAAAAEAESKGDKVRAGSLRGAAGTGYKGARALAAHIGGALVGEPIPPDQFARWMTGTALTPAGRKAAQRMRAQLADRIPAATVEGHRVLSPGPALMGDELFNPPRSY